MCVCVCEHPHVCGCVDVFVARCGGCTLVDLHFFFL